MNQFKPTTKLEKESLRIVKHLQQNGFKAFWVGGTVRDKLLGKTSDNIDIATSARPEQTEGVLKKLGMLGKSVGKDYGTILAPTKHGVVEITTFRKEGKYVNRRRPQEVIYIDDYLRDSDRRDFTINSMYYDPVAHEVMDPQKGINDLDRKLIKFVGDPKKRIDEDALRMLRAIRFSVQLNFKLEKNSFAAIKTRAKYIQQISGERIKTELDKILVLENKEQGIRLLDEVGLLKFIMPEVFALKKIFHKSKIYHLEGSVFEHTMLVLKNISKASPIFGYAALYHDAGKAVTARLKKKPEGVVNSFPGHEFASADMFSEVAKRLKFSRKEKDLGLWITKYHMARIAFIKNMSEEKKISLAMHKYFPELIELWRADSIGNLRKENDQLVTGNAIAYKEALKLLKKINSKKKILNKFANGKTILKYKKNISGPRVGQLKKNLEIKIVSGEIKNLIDVKNFLKNT